MKQLALVVFAATMLVGLDAIAQSSSHHTVVPVPVQESIPKRPLVLTPGAVHVYGGLGIDLSQGNVGKNWNVPLGTAFGLMPDLEVGLSLALQLYPWAIEDLIGGIRLYGRYLLVEDVIALEAALQVPTALVQLLGVELTAPGRFSYEKLEVFGAGKVAYRGGNNIDNVLISAAATGLYEVVDNLLVVADVGLALSPTHVVVPGLVDQGWQTDVILPLGVGAGYRITDDLFVKAMFNLLDLASKSPFAGRSFEVVLVQALALGMTEPKRPPPPPPPPPSAASAEPSPTSPALAIVPIPPTVKPAEPAKPEAPASPEATEKPKGKAKGKP